VRVRVTVEVGGYGIPGEGMTTELIRALRAAGFEGRPERNTMAKVTDQDLSPDAAVVLAASWVSEPVGWNVYSGASERDVTKPLKFLEFIPNEPRCQAVCLAPDARLKDALKWGCITQGIAVYPVEAAYLNSPVLGPAPLRCELEPHAEGTWHRDGRTWFR
jgi:hypothetical protein